MDFYFTDRKFNLLGVASTEGSTDISLANEEDKLSIEDSVRTLAGSLFYGPESRSKAESMSALGNYVLYKDESGRSVWTTIMEINNDPLAGECVFLAEDAGVDLINELVGPYTADKAYPIASYISRFTADSGFKIGVNEISNLSRKLEWESDESTALARILSVATQFDNAELEFRFEVNGLQVVERYIDIFKKRGKDERVTLYADKDINRITTSGNLYELGTSLKGTGGTPEGKDTPINLKGYKYTDPNGRYVLGSDGIMRDTVAVQKWSRLLSNDNPTPTSSHIQRLKTYETTDQKTLCDNVLRDLKKMAEVELNYEAEIVSLPYGVKIGDTIYLVDEQGELYLSARVLELVRCYSEDRYLATLGNYLIKDSGVDVNLQEIADKLKDQIKPGDTYYPWTRYADDDQGNGMSSVPDGKAYMATIHRKNDPIASDNPEDYAGQWVKVKGDEGTPGTSPIITPNDDGTITIVDDEGTKTTPDLTGPQGDKGVGVDSENTKTDYQLHTSATTPPTGTWVTSPPAVTVGKYLWTRTILEYTDGTKSTPAYSVSGGPGANGSDGKDGQNGAPGADALPVFSGYVTNEAIILSATNSGAVSDFSKATGTFVTYLGQDQLTSGVTYSRVSQSGVTATINTTTGAYSVTAASADSGMVVFKAVYQGIELQKIVSVTKAKQGNTGAIGPKGTDGKDGANGAKGEPGTNGVSSYLHTAWKMADGTFLTSYPSDNLLVDVNTTNKLPHVDGESANSARLGFEWDANGYLTMTANAAGDVYYRPISKSNGTILDPNQTYILSFKYKTGPNNGLRIRSIDSADRYLTLYTDTDESDGKVSFTFNGATSRQYLGFDIARTLTGKDAQVGDWAKVWDLKIQNADYTLVYPKYRGEYTDTIEADSTDPNRYTWTAYLGEQGPPTGVISQSTVPSSPYVGMLWQCTGNIAGYINPATYRWNGSAWEIYQFTAQNIMADTFTGFTFQGVEFIGSRFVSEFDIPLGSGTTAHSQGTTTIADGKMVTDTVQYYPDAGGILQASHDQHLEYSPQNGVYMSLKDRRSDIAQEAQLTPGGLRIKTEVAEAVLSVDTIYSLVKPARRNTAPADDANRKAVVVNYFRVGNLVNVAIKFELLKDTGWVALAPAPPTGYAPASMYQASGVAGSVSYRGQTCMVYYNPDGLRLIPTTGQGTGIFQLSLTWTTNDPFPYGDS